MSVQTDEFVDTRNLKKYRDNHSFSKSVDWDVNRYQVEIPFHLDTTRISRLDKLFLRNFILIYDHHNPTHCEYIEKVIRVRCKMAKTLLNWTEFFNQNSGHKLNRSKRILKSKCLTGIIEALEKNDQLDIKPSLDLFWNINQNILTRLPKCLIRISFSSFEETNSHLFFRYNHDFYRVKIFGADNLNLFENVQNHMVDPNSGIFPIKNRKNDIVQYLIVSDFCSELENIKRVLEKETDLFIDRDLTLKEFIEFYGNLDIMKEKTAKYRYIYKWSHNDKRDRKIKRDRERRLKRSQKSSWKPNLF